MLFRSLGGQSVVIVTELNNTFFFLIETLNYDENQIAYFHGTNFKPGYDQNFTTLRKIV